MAGLPSQLAALAGGIAAEAVRLTPAVISLLAHHPAATLAVSATVLAVVLLVRYAVVLLVAAVAVALLVSAAQPRATVGTTRSCQASPPHQAPGPGACPTAPRPTPTHASRAASAR
jgi:hypothetical protein